MAQGTRGGRERILWASGRGRRNGDRRGRAGRRIVPVRLVPRAETPPLPAAADSRRGRRATGPKRRLRTSRRLRRCFPVHHHRRGPDSASPCSRSSGTTTRRTPRCGSARGSSRTARPSASRIPWNLSRSSSFPFSRSASSRRTGCIPQQYRDLDGSPETSPLLHPSRRSLRERRRVPRYASTSGPCPWGGAVPPISLLPTGVCVPAIHTGNGSSGNHVADSSHLPVRRHGTVGPADHRPPGSEPCPVRMSQSATPVGQYCDSDPARRAYRRAATKAIHPTTAKPTRNPHRIATSPATAKIVSPSSQIRRSARRP